MAQQQIGANFYFKRGGNRGGSQLGKLLDVEYVGTFLSLPIAGVLRGLSTTLALLPTLCQGLGSAHPLSFLGAGPACCDSVSLKPEEKERGGAGPERGRGEVTAAGRKWHFGVLQGGPTPSCLPGWCFGVQAGSVCHGAGVSECCWAALFQLQSWHFWQSLLHTAFSCARDHARKRELAVLSMSSALPCAGYIIMHSPMALLPPACDFGLLVRMWV